MSNDFETDLIEILNRYGIDSTTNTPDFILAKLIKRTLNAYAEARLTQDEWEKG